MRTRDRGVVGRTGEDAALAAYEDRGFHLLARNWRCSIGEIDLVLHRRGLLVFCEVKTRTGWAFGGGFDAVTREKRSKLRRLAEAFLLSERPPHTNVRFDVASASIRGEQVAVELFEDAF